MEVGRLRTLLTQQAKDTREAGHPAQAKIVEADIEWLEWGAWRYIYEDDPVNFINNECWIFNPDHNPSIERFRLYPFQIEFVLELYQSYLDGEDVLSEKSRQMGASWMYCAFFLWGVLFRPNFTGFVLSYKEDLVDDPTINSLFGKMRFMYERLQREVRAPLKIKNLRIENPRSKAFIVGETSNPNAGRGGSYSLALWDETASTPKSEVIYQAFHSAGRCKCYLSTPRGKGNVFSRLRFDPDSGVKILTLHWSKHPEKNQEMERDPETGKWTSPWYRAETRGMTEEAIAQELDIDYEVSARGRVYEKLTNQLHLLKGLEFSEDRETVLAWDLGVSDETFCSVMQRDNQGAVGIVDEIRGDDEEIRFYIDLVHGLIPAELEFMSREKQELFRAFSKRAQERGYKNFMNVAGPDVTQRSITGKRSVRMQFTRASQLNHELHGSNGSNGHKRRMRGPYKNLRMVPLTGYSVLDRIVVMKKLINPTRQRFAVAAECRFIWERLMNYVWDQDASGENKQTPKHDWASHGADSAGYGALFFEKKRTILAKPENL